jgi:TM2 domain-containing membrane protein YozV
MSDSSPDASKKVSAGVCGILLGALGIHKFILGYTTEGTIMLLVSLLTCGIGATVMAIIGLIEGISYLSKTDADFVNTYITNKKGWM